MIMLFWDFFDWKIWGVHYEFAIRRVNAWQKASVLNGGSLAAGLILKTLQKHESASDFIIACALHAAKAILTFPKAEGARTIKKKHPGIQVFFKTLTKLSYFAAAQSSSVSFREVKTLEASALANSRSMNST